LGVPPMAIRCRAGDSSSSGPVLRRRPIPLWMGRKKRHPFRGALIFGKTVAGRMASVASGGEDEVLGAGVGGGVADLVAEAARGDLLHRAVTSGFAKMMCLVASWASVLPLVMLRSPPRMLWGCSSVAVVPRK